MDGCQWIERRRGGRGKRPRCRGKRNGEKRSLQLCSPRHGPPPPRLRPRLLPSRRSERVTGDTCPFLSIFFSCDDALFSPFSPDARPRALHPSSANMSYPDYSAAPNSPGGMSTRRLTNRNTNRYSVTALFSMAAEQDVEVEDELGRGMSCPPSRRVPKSHLCALCAPVIKPRNACANSSPGSPLSRSATSCSSAMSVSSTLASVCSSRTVWPSMRYVVPSFCIQSPLIVAQQNEVEKHLEEVDATEGHHPDDRKLQQYSNLFFLLQSEPRHIASLCRLVSLTEIDTLLQTVMFTLYGNQYESREEHLLLTMFQSVLSSQFETATEFGSLLRANTPVSRMMTTYTRRGPGQSYLKSVLAERINSLIEHKDLNLEINPVKVYEQMIQQIEEETGSLPPNLPRGVAPEVAAANADVQAIIAPRLTMLMEIANSFLLTIMESMESVPYGIRWICKQIRSLTRVSHTLSFSMKRALILTRAIAKVPRRHGLCYLLADWWILLPALHQPCDCHTAGIYARRGRSCETSQANIDLGTHRAAVNGRHGCLTVCAYRLPRCCRTLPTSRHMLRRPT